MNSQRILKRLINNSLSAWGTVARQHFWGWQPGIYLLCYMRKIQYQIVGPSKLWDTLLQLPAPNAHAGNILTTHQKIWFGTVLLRTLDSISRNPSDQTKCNMRHPADQDCGAWPAREIQQLLIAGLCVLEALHILAVLKRCFLLWFIKPVSHSYFTFYVFIFFLNKRADH